MRRYGRIEFSLTLNNKDRTTFALDSEGNQSSYSAYDLNREISRLVDKEIRYTEKNEFGSFSLQGLWFAFEENRIKVFATYVSSDKFPKTALELANTFLRKLQELINDCLKKHEVELPEGQIEYNGTFWMPFNDLERTKSIKWYVVRSEEICDPRESLKTMFGFEDEEYEKRLAAGPEADKGREMNLWEILGCAFSD